MPTPASGHQLTSSPPRRRDPRTRARGAFLYPGGLPGPFRGDDPCLAWRVGPKCPPEMRSAALPVRFVIAALVLLLGAGSGLSGLVRALGATSAHVCTCASGGSHASCPVCNQALQAPSRSRAPVVDGLPCGDRRIGTVASTDPVTLPTPSVGLSPCVARVDMPHLDDLDPVIRFVDPPTPPPRIALPG